MNKQSHVELASELVEIHTGLVEIRDSIGRVYPLSGVEYQSACAAANSIGRLRTSLEEQFTKRFPRESNPYFSHSRRASKNHATSQIHPQV
jgi:hypothetical protein